MDLAWEAPGAGAVFGLVLLVAAAGCYYVYPSTEFPMSAIRPFIAMVLSMLGALGLLVSGIAFLRKLIFER